MDIVDILQKEHENIANLFPRYHENHDPVLLDSIVNQLIGHATLEERHVYPTFSEVDSKAIKHSEKEHKDITKILDKITTASIGDDKCGLVKELEEAVSHHVKEEEENIFPHMQEKLTYSVLEALGEDFLMHKDEFSD